MWRISGSVRAYRNPTVRYRSRSRPVSARFSPCRPSPSRRTFAFAARWWTTRRVLSRPPPPLARPEVDPEEGARRVSAKIFSRTRPRRRPLAKSSSEARRLLSRESVVAARAERGSIRILLLLLRVREVSRGAAFSQRLGFLPRHRRGDVRLQSLRAGVAKHPRKLLRLSSNRARVLQQEIQLVGVHGQQFIHHGLWESRARRLHSFAHPLEEVVILGSRSDVFGRRRPPRAIERVDGGVGAGIDGDVAKIDRKVPTRRVAKRVGQRSVLRSEFHRASPFDRRRHAHVREERLGRAAFAGRANNHARRRFRNRERRRRRRRRRRDARGRHRRRRLERVGEKRARRRGDGGDSGPGFRTRIAAAVGSGHVAGLGRARGCESRIRERLRDVPPSEIRAPREAAKNQRAETPKPPEAYGSFGCVFVRVLFASVADAASACASPRLATRARVRRRRREAAARVRAWTFCRTRVEQV